MNAIGRQASDRLSGRKTTPYFFGVGVATILTSGGNATISTLAQLNDVITQAAFLAADSGTYEINLAANSTIDLDRRHWAAGVQPSGRRADCRPWQRGHA